MTLPFLVVIGLFVLILTLLEIGWRVGVRRRRRNAEGSHTGLGAIDGAIFGLMGLLVDLLFREQPRVSTRDGT